MMPYIGSLIGLFIFSYFADNKGRRSSLGISWLLVSIGALILAISWDYWVACVGFFIAGYGINSAVTLHYCFINVFSCNLYKKY